MISDPDDEFSNQILSVTQIGVLYGSVIFCFLMSFISFTYPFFGSVKIYFFLALIFHWGLYRPHAIPAFLVFALGLIVGFIESAPMGLHGLLFCLLQWLVIDQRKFLMGQSFFVVWLGFSILAAAYISLQILIYSVLTFNFVLMPELWVNAVFSIALFPAIHRILHIINKFVSQQR